MIDTHCHLNFPDAFPDVGATISRAKQNHVARVIVVGCDSESSERAVDIAEKHDEAYACVGWHPTYAAKYSDSELKTIAQLASHPKSVAIGEIGLDYHWDYSTPEEQRKCTRAHLELAAEMNKPVVFHCREAYPDLLSWLESLENKPPAMILHCFSGNGEDLKRARALDCYFGADGPITYKNANNLRALLASLPRDRILIETDAPYLAPHPFRGKPNEPAMVALVNAKLAEIWGASAAQADEITTANALRAFW